MNCKIYGSLLALSLGISFSASPEKNKMFLIPLNAYVTMDKNGNITDVKGIEPAQVTRERFIHDINKLIEMQLLKEGVTPEQIEQLKECEYSPFWSITGELAQGTWHFGKGLYYLSYEAGRGFVFVVKKAGQYIVLPLAQKALDALWNWYKIAPAGKQKAGEILLQQDQLKKQVKSTAGKTARAA